MGRQTIEILGVSVNPITLAQALRAIDEMAQDDQNHYIVTPNPEMVMYARTCPEFRETLNRASLSLVDGFGLLWAAKYLSLPLTTISGLRDIQEFWQFIWTSAAIVLAPKALDIIPERLTGADMVWEIAKLASERDQSIFLLGGQPGVASTAGSLLQQMYPRLRLACGTSAPVVLNLSYWLYPLISKWIGLRLSFPNSPAQSLWVWGVHWTLSPGLRP